MYLSKNTFVEPDLVAYPRGIKLEEVKGTDIVLAIEVIEVRGLSMAFLAPMSLAVVLLTNLILVFGSIRTSKMALTELPEAVNSAGGSRE